MNPPLTLKILPGVACAALLVLPLPAQTTPAVHEPHPAVLLQDRGPVGAIHAHVCGFHFYSGDLKRAVRADHYCSHLNGDVFQCIIYDSDKKDARLIGVEYIISEIRFNQLPAEEKKLWHSHRYEVMSGLLTAPGLAGAAEQELMQGLVSTYGKTWHLWQVDRGDRLPLGLPKLMMGFTADGQIDPEMLAERERGLPDGSRKRKAARAGFPARPVAPGADGWSQAPAFQLDDALLK